MVRKKSAETAPAAPANDQNTGPLASAIPPPEAPVAVPLKDRQVIYPTPTTEIFYGANAMTVEKAKEILGWVEEGEAKFGTDSLLTDRNGRKIRCLHNADNRPFYEGDCEKLIQEHMNKRWKLNGEALIISRTGRVLSGQHRGISLILGEQDRTSEKKKERWLEAGHTEPLTMETFVNYGISDDDAVINTVDTGKTRTLTDVLYRSHHFQDLKPSARKTVARVTDHAVRQLWNRTGARNDPFAPKRTHAEAMDFIDRHPHIVKAVKHIVQEYGDGDRRKVNAAFMSPGYAAALLYLMAATKTDGSVYRGEHPRSEKSIDLSLWDKACEFWMLLASANPALLEIRHAIARLVDAEDGSGGANLAERIGTLVKAWPFFAMDEKFTEKDLHLESRPDDDGIRRLVEHPVLEGLDVGDQDAESADPDAPTADQMDQLAASPEELARRAEQVRLDTEKEKEFERQKKIENTKKRLLENRAAKKEQERMARNGAGENAEPGSAGAETAKGPPVPRKREPAPAQ